MDAFESLVTTAPPCDISEADFNELFGTFDPFEHDFDIFDPSPEQDTPPTFEESLRMV